MSKVALVSTIHDPKGEYASFIRKLGPRLREIFGGGIYIAGTKATAGVTYDSLRDYCGMNEGVYGELLIRSDVQSRKIVLGRICALSRAFANKEATHFITSDFDRILKAVGSHDEEFTRVIDEICSRGDEYVVLGRTKWALSTHPAQQLKNERLVNALIGEKLGLGEPLDVSTGANMFSRRVTEGILAFSELRTEISATDTVWPAVARKLGFPVREEKMDAFEYETATFKEKDIAAAGDYETWVRQVYDTPASEEYRRKSAEQAIAAFESTLERDDISLEGVTRFMKWREGKSSRSSETKG